MTIAQDISSWDGKSSSDIDAIYLRYCHDESFEASLIELLPQEMLQIGVTWLLKRYLQAGQQLATEHCVAMFNQLINLPHWQAKLHILQCFDHLKIAKAEKKNVELFIRQCLIDNNKFVRAWAYNGLSVLARQFPEYQEETKQFFEMAMRDEAPSVKARIRQIMKTG